MQTGRLAVGDKVKTSTKRFGDEYAVGKPEFTFGVVKKIKGKLASILWEGEKRGMNSKVSHLIRVAGTSIMMAAEDGEHFAVATYKIENEDAEQHWDEAEQDKEDKILFDQLEKDMTDEDWEGFKKEHQFASELWDSLTILPVMEVGSRISGDSMGGTWPRDFYEALVRPDWRSWVEAVKNEIESWITFDACVEIPYSAIQQGASVIPLGSCLQSRETVNTSLGR